MHTPGPWIAWMRGKTICVLGPKGDHHRPVIAWSGFDSCNLPLAKQRANARLAAAAPQLYDAAEDALAAFKLLVAGMSHDRSVVDMIKPHIDELEIALAKAGRPTS